MGTIMLNGTGYGIDQTAINRMDTAIANNTNMIADQYITTKTYNVGDKAIHDGKLYKCIASTSGTWTANKWQEAKSAVTNWGDITGTLSNQTDLNTALGGLQSQIDNFTQLPTGSTSADAELMNIRVGYNNTNYNTAGDAVRGQVTDLHTITDGHTTQLNAMKTGFDEVTYASPAAMVQGCDQKLQDEIGLKIAVVENGKRTYSIVDFENGSISSTDGSDSTWEQSIRCRTKSYFTPDNNGESSIACLSGFTYMVAKYNLDGSYVSMTDWATVVSGILESGYKYRFVIKKTNGTAISPQDVANKLIITFFSNLNLNEINQFVKGSYLPDWILGNIDTSSGAIITTGADNKARNLGFIDLSTERNRQFSLWFDSGYQAEVFKYKADETFVGYDTWIEEAPYIFENGFKYRILATTNPSSSFVDLDSVIGKFKIIASDLHGIAAWDYGGISIATGTDDNTKVNNIRSNYFVAKEGTIFVPHVYGIQVVHFYKEDHSYIGNNVSLGYTAETLRANSFVMPYTCTVRIEYSWSLNNGNYNVQFGSKDAFAKTFSMAEAPYDVPEYFKAAVMNQFNRMLEYDDDYFSVVFVTDVHEYSYHNNSHVYCSNALSSYLINGGDSLSMPRIDRVETISELDEHISKYVKSEKPVIFVKGNHDISQMVDGPTSEQWKKNRYSQQMWYEQCQKPLSKPYYVYDDNDKTGGYFYVDNEEYKTRIICINTFKSPTGVHEIGINQLRWVSYTALDLSEKEDQESWKVFAVSHSQIMSGVALDEPVATDQELALGKIFKAATNKLNLGSVPVPGLGYVDMNFSNATFDFMFYICGHVHFDSEHCTDGYYHITTTCDHPLDTEDHYPREIGTIKEYAFDVLQFLFSDKQIKFFRIGVGYDRLFNYEFKKLNSGTLTLTSSLNNPTWSSENSDVATVSNGVVTKVGSGYTLITATDANNVKELFAIDCN